ncbi:MAG: hypothetical protein LBD41_06880 [Clostridiales Family XIII bacterium]|jgi:hypothetical protein|nr:hypothetical protein [Clostridiales Family XIII bacterium]
MNKKDAAQKIIKLLALYNDPFAAIGEKNNSLLKINDICEKYHLRLHGNLIIDTDIEEENKKRILQQKIETTINPEQTNMYVIYKGKKYYAKKGSHGGPVPKSEYRNTYISDDINRQKLKIIN